MSIQSYSDREQGEPALGGSDEIPAGLDRWNWGAFLLNWIWGIGNSTFIALLALIPGVNIVMMFVLGARGSKWAWRNRLWRDAEQFRRVQRNWAIAGVITWIATIGGCATLVGSVPVMLRSSDAFQMTMDAVNADARVKDALGENLRAGFWIGGNLSTKVGGSGSAQFVMPVKGSAGAGTVTAQAVRKDGTWSLHFVAVHVDGSEMPIVVVREGEKSPGAEVDI